MNQRNHQLLLWSKSWQKHQRPILKNLWSADKMCVGCFILALRVFVQGDSVGGKPVFCCNSCYVRNKDRSMHLQYLSTKVKSHLSFCLVIFVHCCCFKAMQALLFTDHHWKLNWKVSLLATTADTSYID